MASQPMVCESRHWEQDCRVARQTAIGGEGIGDRPDNLRIIILCVCNLLADRDATYCFGIAFEQMGDLLHHRRQAASVTEILHQETARGHQIKNGRDITAVMIPIIQCEWNADATGQRDKMNYGIG